MNRLLDTMRILRAPSGCPWDREQTHLSLRPYLLEEAAEAVDALSREDDADVVGELGDVLLQIAFHAVIAEEDGRYTYRDVENAIVEKLVRRHPHVFGDVTVDNAGDVVRNWQAIKREERGGREKSLLESIPAGLGALAREAQVQKHAEPSEPSRQSVEAFTAEMPETEAAFGELLARVVAWARASGVDPEVALRAHTARRLS
ncbi:MazG family protein [Deinococcus yavapaiensis]|nr:MazG family protein [Deinococcus yavapaiensis]